jgi:hypothetical protein
LYLQLKTRRAAKADKIRRENDVPLPPWTLNRTIGQISIHWGGVAFLP